MHSVFASVFPSWSLKSLLTLEMAMCAAGLDIPSRASSGALVRLTALRHMLGQRATSSRSAAELAHLLSYGAHTSLPAPPTNSSQCALSAA